MESALCRLKDIVCVFCLIVGRSINNELVEVFNFLNDRIRGELTPEMPRFQFGDDSDAPTLMNDGSAVVREDGSVPFILPWEKFGNQVSLSWDYTHRYRNPVTPDKWPAASTGEFINPSEHFAIEVLIHFLDIDVCVFHAILESADFSFDDLGVKY